MYVLCMFQYLWRQYTCDDMDWRYLRALCRVVVGKKRNAIATHESAF